MLTRNQGQTLSSLLIIPAIWLGRPVEPNILPDAIAFVLAVASFGGLVYYSIRPAYRSGRRRWKHR